jgi:tetratricopeptide (TPR) repeat protein
VALTDPELDLLLELLSEDPASDVYVQVGEELVRRARWVEAHQVLKGGTAARRTPARALAAFARAAFESGNLDDALHAVARVRQRVPELPASLARVEILALERSGRYGQARAKIAIRLAADPTDVVAEAAFERLEAPPPDVGKRARDPFYTVARAEEYAAMGRTDRAVRAFRRILLHNRSDQALASRLSQLLNAPHARVEDDLSEELADPSLAPPDLLAPRPRLRDLRRATPPPLESDPTDEAPRDEAFRGLVELVIEGDFDDLDDLDEGSPRPRRPRR